MKDGDYADCANSIVLHKEGVLIHGRLRCVVFGVNALNRDDH